MLEGKNVNLRRAGRVLKPVRKHNRKARKVLELGVGIGAVLANFPKRFDIYGPDIERSTLRFVRRKSR